MRALLEVVGLVAVVAALVTLEVITKVSGA